MPIGKIDTFFALGYDLALGVFDGYVTIAADKAFQISGNQYSLRKDHQMSSSAEITEVKTETLALHKTVFARVAASITILSSALVIIGFFSPWLNYKRINHVGTMQLSGLSLALSPFQDGNHLTLEAFAACTLVMLPLVFANFLLAMGVISLFRPLPLVVQSLIPACAIVELFTLNSIFSFFLSYGFSLGAAANFGLGLSFMLLGSLVLVVGSVLSSKIPLLVAHTPSQRRFTAAALFSILGGAIYCASFFIPTYFSVIPGSPRHGDYYSNWTFLTHFIMNSPDQKIFYYDQFTFLLLPLIAAGLALGVGIACIFRKPGTVMLSLYALAVLLGLNSNVGSYFFLTYQSSLQGPYSYELGFGPVLDVLGHTLILAGAIALALHYYRDHRSQPAQ